MHLLLVEGNYWVEKFIQMGLISENMSVDLAIDGRRAIETSATYTYDIILLDVMYIRRLRQKVDRGSRQSASIRFAVSVRC